MLSFPVNSLLSSNISILIGPMETSAVIATHPLCSRASVPQIAPLTSLEIISEGDSGLNYLLRMSPTEKLKAKAIAEIIKRYKWETMAVLGYQNKEGEVSNKFMFRYNFVPIFRSLNVAYKEVILFELSRETIYLVLLIECFCKVNV